MHRETSSVTGHEPTDPLLSMTLIGELVGLRATAVKALVRRPGFPAPYRLSQRVTRWRRSEVDRWLETQRSPLAATTTTTCPSIRRGPARRRH